ncbi:MAG: SH3 domain-containing protein [Clostridia bacterium]|nr:SH3 domain-containing protein [Clostridia bacterium]
MKKSIVISLLTVATLLCTALYSFASTGMVTTDTLRLRKEPSTDSSTIALLSVNDEVEILEEEYGWYKVKSGDKVGYVAAQYIKVLTDSNNNNENLNKDNKEDENTNTNTETTGNKSGEDVTVLVKGEKIYITPLINSLVLNVIEEERQIEVISEINGWSYMKMGTTSGWVRTENIQKKEVGGNTSNPENNDNNNTSSQKTGYITANSVNFRKTPSTSGEIITKLSRNAKVTVITQDQDWAQIEYNGNTGYVSTDYISDKELETTSRSGITRTASTNNEQIVAEKSVESSEEIVTSGTVTGKDIVEYAKLYLGYKYTSGGSTPNSGFDCSGFTTYVYKHFGISLSRTSSGQSSNGVAVSRENLALGDIICFSGSSSSKKIGHVGIYVGNGKFIHSANSRRGVIYSNVSGDGYYFVTARRVV